MFNQILRGVMEAGDTVRSNLQGTGRELLPMEQMVDLACDAGMYEPNLSLNLEICDQINQKQKSYPRDVAMAICKTINLKPRQSGILACTLLDNCVKNCGYPFHLVISSKEFLNELVKRFPDRPINIGPLQHQILVLIQQWNATLCVNSRYKDDFKHINDMYRLLQYKGYRFPGLSEHSTAGLVSPGDVLKTEDELEQEDRVAQGAKLQELLRLGTPAALEEANELMKIMAGYDLEKKPDYKKMVSDELAKIEQKCFLLNDMLLAKKPHDRWDHDSALEVNAKKENVNSGELHGQVKTAQNRIQKMIEDGENEERMDHLLQINDFINNVLNKYQAFKKGEEIPKSDNLSYTAASARSDQNNNSRRNNNAVSPDEPKLGMISLIDFDDCTIPPVTNSISPSSGFPVFQSSSSSVSHVPPSVVSNGGGGDLLGDLTSLDFNAKPSIANQFMAPNLTRPPTTQQNLLFASPAASTSAFTGVNNNNSTMGLGGVGFGGMTTSPFTSQAAASVKAAPISLGGGDKREVVFFNKNGLQIKLRISISNNGSLVQGQFVFMNVTPVPFSGLSLQLSVPKTMTLKLESMSATVLPPLNTAQITQSLQISNPNKDQLRMRYKLQYSVNGAIVDEIGDFADSESGSSSTLLMNPQSNNQLVDLLG